jgi:Zn-dependent metalloprotease
MLNKYIIYHVSLFMILLCSVVFADEREVHTPGASLLDGLNTFSNQSLDLTVQGNDIEMAICTMDNLTHTTGSGQGHGTHAQETEFVLKKSQRDGLGYRHVRLKQRYKGLPVVGAESIVHINRQNIVCKVNGKCCYSDINISIIPDIDADVALQIGLAEHKGKAGLQISNKPSLLIYGQYLAYHYVISYEDKELGQWWYYIDAHSGKLIEHYNNIQHAPPSQASGSHASINGNRLTGEDSSSVAMSGFYESSGSGNYFLYNFNEKWGVYDRDVPDWEQNNTDNWSTTDQAAVSAGKNFQEVQDWVTNVLGRNSFNNAGAFATAYVHEGTNYVNAYWNGSAFYFGDGNGSTANALTVLDIVGHEYGHAITQYTSNLIYTYESGALNESYSDIMGTLVEFAKQTDGTAVYPDATPGHSDWLMGEDCWLPNSGDALRDIRNPQHYGQPSYYQGTYWYTGSGDNGGVHYNSGVQNFAFYLLAVGGSGTNDGHSYGPITGLGVVAAGRVAMRANMAYLTSSSQYSDSRAAWISAAQDLGYSTTTVETVWDACGVSPYSSPSGDSYEPDDSSVQATNITSGSPQTHSIYPLGDEDWLTFTLASSSEVLLETSGTNGNDTRMWLYDSNLSQIEYNDDGGAGYFSLIDRVCDTDELPIGTYYVKIDDYGDNSIISSYDLSLTVTSCVNSISKDDLTVDFGPSYGINAKYNNGGPWTGLHTFSAGSGRMVTGDLDGNGISDLIVDFGPPYGINVLYNNGRPWTGLHTFSAGSGGMVTGDLDGNGISDLIVDFGPPYGINVLYNNGRPWTGLHTFSAGPGKMVMGDIDGNGMSDLIVDFGPPYGINVLYNNSGSWTGLHTFSAGPGGMVMSDVDGQ